MKHTFYYKRHTFFFYYALFMAVFGLIRVFSGSSFIISFSLITPGFIFIVVANGFRQKRIEIASGELKCYNAFNYQFKSVPIDDMLSANLHSDQLYILFRDGSHLQVYKKQMPEGDLMELHAYLDQQLQQALL